MKRWECFAIGQGEAIWVNLAEKNYFILWIHIMQRWGKFNGETFTSHVGFNH